MFTSRMIGFPSMGRRSPFAEMERMAKQMDLLSRAIFGRPEMRPFAAKVFPAINLTEDNEKYYVRAELPGISADAINLEVTGRNLAISGERVIPSEGENARYHRREREAGRFSRMIGLPGDVDAESVAAKLVDGLLTISIAKAASARPRQIAVN